MISSDYLLLLYLYKKVFIIGFIHWKEEEMDTFWV